ncbi:hypothetical protein ICR95_26265 (plasmid) [Priestia megaterium]|uniref:hypothetical protein n=1 Tax=Priestia TaxID=2800373 RepID=UPI00196B3554|nr:MULTISPECIES: hypothetical protein [Priestia]MCU7712928.1 hypothetical protein [Priestia megaterium]MCW1048854.1 hypothetical protein [Priestia sp. JV24]QSF36109.1 hypothetical protein ICR95_26265 [Priestia megaterium]
MKKIKFFMLICAALFVLTAVGFSVPNDANAAYKCYGGERCKVVNLTYKKDKSKSSAKLYLYKGESARIDFETNSNSLHQVAFAAYDYDGKRITKWVYAGSKGGSDYEYFDVPYTGSYYIKALCKGGETNTCSGGGTIKKP